jgi:hypothetical protein
MERDVALLFKTAHLTHLILMMRKKATKFREMSRVGYSKAGEIK